MTRRLWPRAVPPAFLALVCLLLLLFLARSPGTELRSRETARQGETGSQVIRPLEPVAQEPPPEGAFDLVVARNLFAIDRAPPEDDIVAPSADQPQANASELELTGVLLGEASETAILLDRRSDETVRLALNEEYRGWRLEALDATAAVLRRGEEEVRLALRFSPEPAQSRDPTIRRDSGSPLPLQIRRGDGRGNPAPARRQRNLQGSGG